MKIGYPCVNLSVGCSSSRTFRLKSYSEERLIETIRGNLECLQRILEFNISHDIYHFRLSSDLVPLASHPINTFNWQSHFSPELRKIGRFLKKHKIRTSMHPGQYTVLNTKNPDTLVSTIAELEYHDDILSGMSLNQTAKIQIHVGGVYGEKDVSMRRFIERYDQLETRIRKRLIIENDERSYSIKDCMQIHDETRIPVILDTLHHSAKPDGMTLKDALDAATSTWQKRDGLPLIDYSSQAPDGRPGKHSESIDLQDFKHFLEVSKNIDIDIMLEIKDKDISAIKAISLAEDDSRFWRPA